MIALYDEPGTLVYCDPPYLPDTRSSPNAYRHEMDETDHIELALALRRFRGKVVLSGYPSGLYETLLSGWRREDKEIANHASQQTLKVRKTESLWMNY